jgi:hypothetical protein
MSNLPVPSTYAEVAAILRDMATFVEAGDSFEGSIEYTIPSYDPPPLDPDARDGWEQTRDEQPEVMVRAAYRIGNSMGQGGMRIFGSITQSHPGRE